MIVEGINCAVELLNSDYRVEKVLINKENEDKYNNLLKLCNQKNVRYEILSKNELEKITKSSHQGVVCFVKPYEYYDLKDILDISKSKGTDPFILILDRIMDPHNVGALIRSAECFGVDGIIIPKNRACEINETVFKTSAGAIAHIKVAQVTNISQTIEKLKKENIWCYALEAGDTNISDCNLTGGVALVVGSEGFGVGNLISKTCDGTLSIPMCGKLNSLNASNAGAIAMYEVVRQKRK